jgi:peptide-N4-(N-acetyl-beta-glucosaminyl)asparagine amidase
MLGCSSIGSLFGLSSSSSSSYPNRNTFLLYKKVTEQYRNPEILSIVRSLIPQGIILQTKTTKYGEWNIIPLLRWFKNDFMKWTPKDPACDICANRSDSHRSSLIERCGNNSNNSKSVAAIQQQPTMQLKKVIVGNSWKMRKLELFACKNCNHEYAFPRYAEILKIAETKTGRCSEWSMLFGAILSSLGIRTRIVHDFLDHCWNEVMFSYPEGDHWIHVDCTLDYPVSLNHPCRYEQNWAKEYEYVLAFTADKVEDVTQTYTLKWEAINQRRQKKRKEIDFIKDYSSIL